MLMAGPLNVALADLAYETFTYADGAVPANLQTGQAWTNIAGTQAISTNRLSLGTGSTRTINYSKPDVMLRVSTLSNGGEGVMFRREAGGTYYWVTNDSVNGTRLGYYNGTSDVILATVAGSSTSDLLTVVAQGVRIDVIRNNIAIIQQTSLTNTVNATATSHGVVNKGAGTVLVDNFLAFPIW